MKNVSLSPLNPYHREKASLILDFQRFNVNTVTMDFVQNYWTEDIKLMKQLKDAEGYHFLKELENVGTCVDIFKNPGVKIQQEYLCDIPGLCQVQFKITILK